ncbi:hypothetical protein WA026_016425 [Henosepilachna vigintioctopunctata]|uniref:Uncharacterized protein n=1 Tax=Henosepilachna vigintioctopunctata TaxID=420089 RepID=A0AAW1UD02_9CUCU
MYEKKLSFILLLVLLIASDVAEGRRKILKGRKTMNRTYFRNTSVPSWVIVLVVGLGELFIGGMVYLLMKCCILDKLPTTVRYAPAPISP